MDAGTLGVFVPITAIVMAMGIKIVKVWTSHRERMVGMGVQPNSSDHAMRADFEALRDEILRLRDTTTQYDMSVEKSLEEVRRRLDFLETARRNGAAAAYAQAPSETEAQVQALGNPGS